MAMAQQLRSEGFRKVVIDCHSVGYAASELLPIGAENSFRVRNVVLCILNLVKIYLLVAFDFKVLGLYDKTKQMDLVNKCVQVLSSKSRNATTCLENLTRLTANLETSTDTTMKDVCGEIQKALLRQDVLLKQDTQGISACISLWIVADLPRIVLWWNVKDEQEKKNHTQKNICASRIVKLYEPEEEFASMKEVHETKNSPKCIVDLAGYARKEDALIVSNDETLGVKAVTIEESMNAEELTTIVRVPFAITKDSAYFYIPKDPSGRNKMTIMQYLTKIKLSGSYGRALTDALRKAREKVIAKRIQAYKYLLVVDFEATCERENPMGYQPEIIEFPLVLLNLKSGEVEDHFRQFCRPKKNPRLSDFCSKLTGVRQCDVDNSDSFSKVLAMAENWLLQRGIFASRYALAADCEADVATLLRLQCKLDGVLVPKWAAKWVNLQETFKRYYGLDKRPKLDYMLMLHDLEFDGRRHSGLDDARNVARVAKQLMLDGCRLLINQCLDETKDNHYRSVEEIEAEKL